MTETVKIAQSWDAVTLGQYQKYVKVKFSEMEDMIDYNCTLLSIFSDRDYVFWLNSDVEDYIKAVQVISFINTPLEPSEITHKYIAGDITYNIAKSIPALKKCPISQIKALHLIGLEEDAQDNNDKSQEEKIDQLHFNLSLMMIPEGQEYGKDGYSITENAEHLQNHISIRDALAVSAFFLQLWNALTTGLRTSLERQIKKMSKTSDDKEQKELLIEMMMMLSNLDHAQALLNNGDGHIYQT